MLILSHPLDGTGLKHDALRNRKGFGLIEVRLLLPFELEGCAQKPQGAGVAGMLPMGING